MSARLSFQHTVHVLAFYLLKVFFLSVRSTCSLQLHECRCCFSRARAVWCRPICHRGVTTTSLLSHSGPHVDSVRPSSQHTAHTSIVRPVQAAAGEARPARCPGTHVGPRRLLCGVPRAAAAEAGANDDAGKYIERPSSFSKASTTAAALLLATTWHCSERPRSHPDGSTHGTSTGGRARGPACAGRTNYIKSTLWHSCRCFIPSHTHESR